MGDVIPIGGLTKLDLDADTMLDACKGKLDKLVIIGWSKDDEEYFASSITDGGEILWLLERMKMVLMEDKE